MSDMAVVFEKKKEVESVSPLTEEEKRKALSEVGTLDESIAKGLDRLSSREMAELMSNLSKDDRERVALGLAISDKEELGGWDMPAIHNYFEHFLLCGISVPAKRHGAGRETLRDAIAGQVEKQSWRQKIGAAVGGFIGGSGQ